MRVTSPTPQNAAGVNHARVETARQQEEGSEIRPPKIRAARSFQAGRRSSSGSRNSERTRSSSAAARIAATDRTSRPGEPPAGAIFPGHPREPGSDHLDSALLHHKNPLRVDEQFRPRVGQRPDGRIDATDRGVGRTSSRSTTSTPRRSRPLNWLQTDTVGMLYAGFRRASLRVSMRASRRQCPDLAR